MKPRHLKEIFKICKGHYNKDKYADTFEALRAYQAQCVSMLPEDIGDCGVYQFVWHMVEEYFTARDFKILLRNMMHDYELGTYPVFPELKFEFGHRYMVELFIRTMYEIQVWDKETGWIIDLSEVEGWRFE